MGKYTDLPARRVGCQVPWGGCTQEPSHSADLIFLSFILTLWAVKQDPFSSSLSSTSTESQRRVLWGLPSFYQSQCEHLTVFFLHDWHLE